METPAHSPNTNSEYGSQHWYNTLLAHISHIGEYMISHELSAEDREKWGRQIMGDARELLDNFKAIQDSERTITLRPSQFINGNFPKQQ